MLFVIEESRIQKLIKELLLLLSLIYIVINFG